MLRRAGYRAQCRRARGETEQEVGCQRPYVCHCTGAAATRPTRCERVITYIRDWNTDQERSAHYEHFIHF